MRSVISLGGIIIDHFRMKNRFQRRLIGLLMATLLAAMGIAGLVLKLQEEAALLSTDLKQVDSESFRIADQFRDLFRQLNDLPYHYGRSHVVPDVAAFNKAIDDLDVWIDVQKPKLISSQEQAVMEQIDHVYDDYKAAAKTLLVRLEELGDASATLDEYTGVRKEAARLFELGQVLSRGHIADTDQLIECGVV